MINQLLYIMYIFTILQLLIIIYLAISKYNAGINEAADKELYDKVIPVYLDFFITGDESKLISGTERNDDPKIIEKILFDYLRNIKGKDDVARITLVAHAILYTHYENMLSRRNWATRMNTLYAIKKFQMKDFNKPLWKHLTHKKISDEEKRQIMKTIASFQDLELVTYIRNDLTLTERQYIDILMKYDIEYLPFLIDSCKWSKNWKYIRAVIRIITMRNYLEGFPFVLQYLNSSQKETRLRVLQGLDQMSYLIDPEVIKPFLISEYWEERMAATRVCAKLKLDRFKPYLYNLIGDSNWWVRYTAGETIRVFSDGDIMLNYIATEHEDKYARDMAKKCVGDILL